jgi:transcriptional regulator with XRE-family HTH domain
MASLMPNGEMIRRLRAARGWTQVTLAEKCDCSDRTIANVEKGKSTSSSMIEAIAKAFEIDPSELIRRDSTMPSDLPSTDKPFDPDRTPKIGPGAPGEPGTLAPPP